MKTDLLVNRHVGITEADEQLMLQKIGVKNLDELIYKTIPSDIRLKEPLDLPVAMTEYEYAKHIAELGAMNKLYTTYIGMGWYNTITPAVIQRNVFENPVWYTSYTPYQSEVSQGRLEALMNFQTAISDLTGMPLANCSLLDEATAAAEAITMMYNLRSRTQQKAGANVVFVDDSDMRAPDKMWKWIKRGVPLRVEVGNRELESGVVSMTRRDLGKDSREFVPLAMFANVVAEKLTTIQSDMYAAAEARNREMIHNVETLSEITAAFDAGKTGFFRIKYAKTQTPEFDALMEKYKVTRRCLDDADPTYVFVAKSY